MLLFSKKTSLNPSWMAGQNEKGASKKNCWEHLECGREPGGSRVSELGVCPVPVHQKFDGAHGGKGAGRACWTVAGSLCGGKVQGTSAEKLADCWKCDFMGLVKKEETDSAHGFSHTSLGIEKSLEKNRGSRQRI